MATHPASNKVPEKLLSQLYQLLEVSITLCCQLSKNCSKSTSVIKEAVMKNTDGFSIMKGSHHVASPNWHYLLSAKMNGTQRDTLVHKSMKNASYVLQYAKRHLSGWGNIEQQKNVAHNLSCYQVILVWRYQLENSIFSNSVATFSVNLKACLGLIIYLANVHLRNWSWFLGDFISWAIISALWWSCQIYFKTSLTRPPCCSTVIWFIIVQHFLMIKIFV